PYVEVREILPESAELQLWPNPSIDWTTVRAAQTFDRLLVYNLTGQLIADHILTSPSMTYMLDVQDLQAGVYSVAVSSRDGSFVGQTSLVK
ncbi:MAG: T9SS type A sorting domain-containing protein, partial [Flavobacteriales bacterium]|nr:T9SS type A sorting domain-containing protein [Flavobacteriales bacterium]